MKFYSQRLSSFYRRKLADGFLATGFRAIVIIFCRGWHYLSRILIGGIFATLIVLFLLRYINPPTSTEMLRQKFNGKPVTHEWVDLKEISPHLISAVIMSEDARFCLHSGIDWRQVEKAWQEALDGAKKPRGASTITMQTAKNLLLWADRSYIRKGLELPIAYMMDLIWSKQRQMEIYLNIIEWGPGIYGAKAAAQHHFKKHPKQLSRREAAQMAAALPNPIERRAGRPGPYTRRIATIIHQRMKSAAPWVNCALP